MTSTDGLTHQAQSRPKSRGARMRMTIAVAALIVVTMLQSRSSSIEIPTAAKPPLQVLPTMVGDISLSQYFGNLSF